MFRTLFVIVVASVLSANTPVSPPQLLFAQILSTGYALVMMAVIVGTALQLGEDGIGSPSAIFLISLSSSFFIAACLHPQEFWCVVPGIIYLLSIPSMYLLLILYSIINLNVVSWGTREVVAKKTKKVRFLAPRAVRAVHWGGGAASGLEDGKVTVVVEITVRAMPCFVPVTLLTHFVGPR